MKTSTSVAAALLGVILVGTIGAGSYWLGARQQAPALEKASATAPAASAAKQRKLLYYRNPMGLADTSPTPKKDPMGMDYVPVYEGEDESGEPASANQIRISTEKIQKLGVRTEAAGMRLLGRTVRAAGRVEADERRIFAVSPKFEGYVERLHVNVTGQPVVKGQPLFEVYSPELVSAQREYAIAMQGVQAMKDAGPEAQSSMKQLAESSLTRLRNWGLSPAQVTALMKTGQPQRTITFPSPVSGIVTEKKAVQGMRFMPGDMLYQVTDLSSVWVVADLAEQDIGLIKTGAKAGVKITAYPNKVFEGSVTYVYPTLKAETRTVAVRVELANPGQLLKPAMYAQVDFSVGREDAGADRTGLGRDRHRHATNRARAGQGRPLRAPRGRAGRAGRELHRSRQGRARRRAGRRRRQLPDRRREQPESGRGRHGRPRGPRQPGQGFGSGHADRTFSRSRDGRPQGRGQHRRHRSEGRHREPQPRTGP